MQIREVSLARRSEGERKYEFQAFGSKYDLNLVKTEGLLPDTLPVYVYGEDENGNPTVDDWTHRVSKN